MKNHAAALYVGASVLALSFMLVGCDREVSKSTSSSVNSDGTVKTQEKTVTQAPDGSVTKVEETKKTTAPAQP
ncbi:MAG: hypothetical protein K8T26_14750 [Lentisphaerae bacterium]|nr:hypothetical protein [Lentisphaerota bacterium]